jgi:hypothetical protein
MIYGQEAHDFAAQKTANAFVAQQEKLAKQSEESIKNKIIIEDPSAGGLLH